MNALSSLVRFGLVLIVVAAAGTGCATPPQGQSRDAPNGGTRQGDVSASVEAAEREKEGNTEARRRDTSDLEDTLAGALDALDRGQIAVGISGLVTVLAELESLEPSDAAENRIRETAESELARLASSLQMLPSPTWFDSSGAQIVASTAALQTGQARMPGVVLTINLDVGRGQAVVSGAPVVFEFVEGDGVVSNRAITDDLGRASATVTDVADAGQEQRIRAILSYRVGSFEYAFDNVSATFVYAPPKRTVAVLSVLTAEDRTAVDREKLWGNLDDLDSLEVDFIQLPSIENPRILVADGGQRRALAEEVNASYLLFVASDVFRAEQVRIGDKVYDIWRAFAKPSVKIVRVADGVVRYSRTLGEVEGQGATPELALEDLQSRIGDAVGTLLYAERAVVNDALTAR